MSAKAREVPKQIAAFGEHEFNETDAESVDILRVKASTIRKHFHVLKGVSFLVAVTTTDRVRVYLFTDMGVMLGGENVTQEVYAKIRLTSRIIAKYERPREPTEEELRMEATEDLRLQLSRAIKRTARFMATSEPEFPKTYVTKRQIGAGSQSWGMQLDSDGTLLFEESAVRSSLSEGFCVRAGVLLILSLEKRQSVFAQLLANAVAMSLLREPEKSKWLDGWRKHSKDSQLASHMVNHFAKNSAAYESNGFSRMMETIQRSATSTNLEDWVLPLGIIHSGTDVAFGTEEYQTFRAFCSTLKSGRRLVNKRHVLESVHLSPRALCNVSGLGIELAVSDLTQRVTDQNEWLHVDYLVGAETRSLVVVEGMAPRLLTVGYGVNLQDIAPKSGGLITHGRDIVRWALAALGVTEDARADCEATLQLGAKTDLPADQKAVLERLSLGKPSILADTIAGSPERVDALIESGNLILVPDFNHIGLDPTHLLVGSSADVQFLVTRAALEWTILTSEMTCHAIVCAPSVWGNVLNILASEKHVASYPVVRATSTRGFLRCEDLLPDIADNLLWK